MNKIDATLTEDELLVDDLMARARAAQAAFEKDATQDRYDRAAQAVGILSPISQSQSTSMCLFSR